MQNTGVTDSILHNIHIFNFVSSYKFLCIYETISDINLTDIQNISINDFTFVSI